ncbi:MAG: HAD family hydrolase [Verrucomicrobia bacterium]|nr:HAD family hydrolase [Verrucomicrobiota bacterium]
MLKFSRNDLVNLRKTHDFLIGVDSDGCVFDTMEVKQINHFHPLIIQHWTLEAISSEVHQAAEFVNLHSRWRGANRFIALLKTFDLLADWPDVKRKGAALPNTTALRAYVNSGLPLGNPSLADEVMRTGNPELTRVLDWSLAVNAHIAETMEEIPPFPCVRACLDKMHGMADLIVVSQTPEEALVNEWNLHGIDGYVDVIAGAELGTKQEHLTLARGDRYPSDHVMLIGDALGDRKAAQAVGAFFFPIMPGKEDESWQQLMNEGLGRFVDGSFAGDHQQNLIDQFEATLPEIPPWQR